jgi:hypothetical protein
VFFHVLGVFAFSGTGRGLSIIRQSCFAVRAVRVVIRVYSVLGSSVVGDVGPFRGSIASLVSGATTILCRSASSALGAAAGRLRTAVGVRAVGIAIIAIGLAPSDSVSRGLSIGVLRLTVVAHPILAVDVGGGGNKVAGPHPLDAGVVVLAGAALTEPHVL